MSGTGAGALVYPAGQHVREWDCASSSSHGDHSLPHLGGALAASDRRKPKADPVGSKESKCEQAGASCPCCQGPQHAQQVS